MANVKLVTTSLIILKRNLLTIKEIRQGINAFALMEKHVKTTNLPLKENIILEAFHLINKTASLELIRQWIKKNRPYLECEKKARKDFERHVRTVERDLKKEKHMDYPDDQDSMDKLFIHEFIFLLCNGRGKIETIQKLPFPEFTTARKSIKQYEMQPLDAIRLDRIFKLDTKEMNDEAKKIGATNPYKIMARMLDAEVQGRKFRFEGIKTTEKAPASGGAGSKQKSKSEYNKSGGKGAQSQPQTISLQNVLEKKLDEKTQMFHDYRDKLADPRFFSPIKTQL
jgi:hypothetical protein